MVAIHNLVTATGGSDYNIEIESVTFSEGMTSVDIPINIIDDQEYENITETFTVSLSTEVPRVQLLGDAVVTIQDNDSKSVQS